MLDNDSHLIFLEFCLDSNSTFNEFSWEMIEMPLKPKGWDWEEDEENYEEGYKDYWKTEVKKMAPKRRGAKRTEEEE